MALKELTATTERRVKVVPGDDPPAPEVMAQAIVDIAEAMKRLSQTRLSESTLHLLISHAAKVPQRDVKNVLWALRNLESVYLKPKAK